MSFSCIKPTKFFVCFLFSDNAEKLEVVLGRTFRKQNSSSEQIFSVEKYWIHEKFDNDTFDNDIGEEAFLLSSYFLSTAVLNLLETLFNSVIFCHSLELTIKT